MMVKDEWVSAAMTDDMVVVELLIRLKQSQAASLAAKSHPMTTEVVPLSWGLKQPRSRLTAASRCDGIVSRKKEADSTRCSPTTPLSWSGGGSPSATADGYEESSRPTILPHHAARSKVTATSEYTDNSSKRCRRKKTFAELKEQESSLLKESVYLKKVLMWSSLDISKREIANLNATFKAERAKNESLKRIKLDLDTKSQTIPTSTSDELLCTPFGQPHQRKVPSESRTLAIEDDSQPQADSKATGTESTGESVFVIPDLNMMPSEDDSYSDALCGMS